ncbi:MAG: DUF4105 domain-containing protein [Bacteroides sp.]|nr:DUF4105 domain-containing protein [Bacteroides sp.]
MIRRLTLLVIAWLATWAAASAAPSDTTVSIVNVYPGRIFYELEGHSALRITMPGADMAVSWGQFDFNTDDFLYRFVKGETDYCVALIPWDRFVAAYARDGRRIVERRLDFDAAQRHRLLALVTDNLRPENAVYRYNYVKDNCATRPLRLVELAAGDTLRLAPSAAEAWSSAWPVTYRNVMRHFHRNYPWYQLGIDLCLGSGVDYQLDRRETTFAPALLDGQIESATAGGRRIVGDSIVWVDTAPDAAVEPPTPWYLTPAAVFALVLAAMAALTVRDLRRRRVTRWADAVLYGIFGLAGLLLTFLIFISVHEATSPNWLYLWLNPLCLLVPALLWSRRGRRLLIGYHALNLLLLAVMTIGWPWLPQSTNPALWLLVAADALRSASYIAVTRRRPAAAGTPRR